MMLYCQYSANKPAKSGLQYHYNPSAFLPAVKNVFTMKSLGIKRHAYEF